MPTTYYLIWKADLKTVAGEYCDTRSNKCYSFISRPHAASRLHRARMGTSDNYAMFLPHFRVHLKLYPHSVYPRFHVCFYEMLFCSFVRVDSVPYVLNQMLATPVSSIKPTLNWFWRNWHKQRCLCYIQR